MGEGSMDGRVLDYVALGILIFVCITIVYGVIYIHDIPYEIAKKRKHPHMDALHTAGWVSLFLMHAIWPFLWIWATLYKPGYGWGLAQSSEQDGASTPKEATEQLQNQIASLEQEQARLQEEHAAAVARLTDRITQLEGKNQQEDEV